VVKAPTQGGNMLYINVKITKAGVTKAHKAKIVEEMTQTLVNVLGDTLFG
jgi:phenylpyruvate tautomerase PptA (4-oxalocrotonate tautomerase family)